MDSKNFSTPLSLSSIQVTDAFWKKEMELVRTEVIPYQWEALNDRVPDAEAWLCIWYAVIQGLPLVRDYLGTDEFHFFFPEGICNLDIAKGERCAEIF